MSSEVIFSKERNVAARELMATLDSGIAIEVTARLRPRLAGAIGAGDAKVQRSWATLLPRCSNLNLFLMNIPGG